MVKKILIHRKATILLVILIANFISNKFLYSKSISYTFDKYISSIKKKKIENDSLKILNDLYIKGVYYFSIGNYVSAYEKISEGIKLAPSISIFHYKMACILEKIPTYANKKKEIFDSVTHINIALGLEENIVYYKIAKDLYIKARNIKKAITIYEIIKNKITLKDEDLLTLASLYEKNKSFQKAIDTYEIIKNKEKYYLNIFEAKIRIFSLLNYDQKIDNEYKLTLIKYPFSEKLISDYVDFLLSKNLLNRAVIFLEEHIKKYFLNYKILLIYAQLIIETKNFDSLKKFIFEVIESEKYNLKSKIELIEFYILNDNIDKEFLKKICNTLIYKYPSLKNFAEKIFDS